MLGNGFDIGFKMPTRYEDFYPRYCVINDKDNDNIKTFKQMLKTRNEDEQKKIIDWSDFEKAFGEHSADPSIKSKAAYLERFEDFVRKFNEYLEVVEKCTNLSNSEAIVKMMENACNAFYKIRKADEDSINAFFRRFGSDRNYNFITFNYTKTVDSCYTALRQHYRSVNYRDVGTLVHIHGYIEENMIVGVNDPSQITNSDFANDPEVVAEIVKPQQNSDARTAYENAMKSVIDSSNVICVYGMSVGATDKKWWEYISTWLSKSDTHILIILKHEEKYNKRFTFDQKKFIDPLIETFIGFSNLPEAGKEKIRKQIYVGINNDVFAMDAFDRKAFEEIYPPKTDKEDKDNHAQMDSENLDETIRNLKKGVEQLRETEQKIERTREVTLAKLKGQEKMMYHLEAYKSAADQVDKYNAEKPEITVV